MRFLFFIFVFYSCSQKDIPIDYININNYETILSAKNKAVVINLWATWCKPCIEEFPELLKLKEEYKDEIDLIFISLDDEERLPEVKSFLNKMNITFKTYIKNGPDEVLFKFMPDDFSGAIPYTIIKNKKNEVVSKLMGKQSYDTFKIHIVNALQ